MDDVISYFSILNIYNTKRIINYLFKSYYRNSLHDFKIDYSLI